jgi:AcrR family transcriptional regulator
MGRPKEHGTETRDALLSAAGAVLHAEGEAAVTVRRVADEVGTTTRAVYSLFGDKNGLMRALFHEAAETMRRHHEAVPEQDDPVAEIVELALAYRAGAQERPNLYALYLGSVTYEIDEEIRALSYRSLERVLKTIRRAVDSGLFPGRDPMDIGRQLWALVHGLASLDLRGFLGREDEARRLWVDALTNALTGYQRAPAR